MDINLKTDLGEFIFVDGTDARIPSFYIASGLVTRALWKRVMENLPPFEDDDLLLPVTHISWNESLHFLEKLKQLTGKPYRLPRSAEWEFAARGGKYSKNRVYSGSDTIDDVAWYAGNSGYRLHRVNEKKPNELGIYDMSGNVWEMCHDFFDAGKRTREIRGGGWGDGMEQCTVISRSNAGPDTASNDQGFRIVSGRA